MTLSMHTVTETGERCWPNYIYAPGERNGTLAYTTGDGNSHIITIMLLLLILQTYLDLDKWE